MNGPTLLGSIWQRFRTDGGLVADVDEKLHLDEVPEGTALPYVVVEHQGEQPSEHTFENTYREDGRFTLRVYDDSLQDVEAIATSVKAAFDEQTIGVAGAIGIRCQRTGYRVRLDRMRSSTAKRVYEVELPYETWIERTY